MRDSLPTAEQLRAAFEQHGATTVGLEEELMLLDAETLDLAPHAAEAIEGLDGRFKLEMPAAQLEIVTAPHPTVAAAAEELARARADLAAAVEGRFRVAGAGAHPFAAGTGPLNPGPRYEAIEAEYASVARRQLVFGLHEALDDRGIVTAQVELLEGDLAAQVGVEREIHRGHPAAADRPEDLVVADLALCSGHP